MSATDGNKGCPSAQYSMAGVRTSASSNRSMITQQQQPAVKRAGNHRGQKAGTGNQLINTHGLHRFDRRPPPGLAPAHKARQHVRHGQSGK